MHLPRFAFTAAAAVAVASCSPASYAPAPQAQPASSAISHEDGRPRREIGCGLANQPLPGHYAVLHANGTLINTVFLTSGVWEYGEVSPATEPAPKSEPSPPPTDVYVYVGRFHLADHNQDGCAYLVTTKNGKPFDGRSNATFDGAPPFAHTTFAIKAAQGGAFRTKMQITPVGGSGTLALSDGSKGTVEFGRRESGADFVAAAMHPHFTFSCDPAKYQYRTVQAAKPGTARGFGFTPANPSVEYRPHFGYCNVENSYLAPHEVTSTQTYTFSHGALDYRLSATFSPSVAWANQPDVAVWEEAYRFDGTRDDRSDLFIAIVRVR